MRDPNQPPAPTSRPARLEPALAGTAFFLAGYTLVSLLLAARSYTAYDANIWWIDLRFLPGPIRVLALLAFSAALLHRAWQPHATGKAGRARKFTLRLLVAVLLLNGLTAWGLHLQQLTSASDPAGVLLGVPLPLSIVLAALVLLLTRTAAHAPQAQHASRIGRVFRLTACASVVALFAALAQMVWFGESDYRRPADAILVYGCKAHPDGTPSQALADRVHTACELYHQGLAPVIVMSGGPVSGSTLNETQVMADYAVSLGVSREAILMDPVGMDTRATADNLAKVLCDASGTYPTDEIRVLAVSHDYHLPRVKLTLQRRGLTAYTVPCEIRRGLPSKPYLMARETAAWWVYYLRPALAATR